MTSRRRPVRAGSSLAAALAGSSLAAALVAIALAASPAIGVTGTITTVAGTGTACFSSQPCGDGGPATSASLAFPIDVAPLTRGDGGGYLIADEIDFEIRKVDSAGVIHTVAGDGTPCHTQGAPSCLAGGPATATHLGYINPANPNDPAKGGPTGVTPLAGGAFLIADRTNNDVRLVSNGTTATIAGTGAPCQPIVASTCGDGGAATSAKLDYPNRAIPLAGGVLISEDVNGGGGRVRWIDPQGIIHTVLGTSQGAACSHLPGDLLPCGLIAGTATPANTARLDEPNGLAATANGGFLVTDSSDNVVLKVLPGADGSILDATVTIVAGTGTAGESGDGGAATAAKMNAPSAVSVAGDGGYVVTDEGGQTVRLVSPAGTISKLAGTADTTCPAATSACGDGASATSALFNTPFGVTIAGDGSVLVADHNDHRIRRVDAGLEPPAALVPGPGPGPGPGPTVTTPQSPAGQPPLVLPAFVLPAINGLSISPRRFRAARSGSSLISTGGGGPATLSFSLTADSESPSPWAMCSPAVAAAGAAAPMLVVAGAAR